MIVRIIIGLLLIPIALLISYFGNYALGAFVLLCQIIGSYEYQRMVKKRSVKYYGFILPALLAISLVPYILSYQPPLHLFFVFAFIIIAGFSFNTTTLEGSINRVSSGLFGFTYLFLPAYYWIETRNIMFEKHSFIGFLYLLFIYLSTWIPDSAAYFTGKAIGKHKISPMISPKKTFEGLMGGIIINIFLTGSVFYFIKTYYFPSLPGNLAHFSLLALILGVTGFYGDLFESMLKRDAGVKDSSNIIPGHGGVLDRLDSFYFNIIIAYFYIKFIIL